MKSKINIAKFLINKSLIDINDDRLYLVIIKAMKNILEICEFYKKNDYYDKIVSKYTNLVKGINEARDPNKYVIVTAMRLSKHDFRPILYSDMPYLKRVIENLEGLYVEISKQENNAMNRYKAQLDTKCGTKPLSKFQIYMGKELKKYKLENPNVSHRIAFGIVSSSWKDSSENPKSCLT
ncbi:5330_t:CDS:1 [Scutellospora calospora]|uniref:5330_t:CDS:1 n=1 Tax=Scutellospora calospora TaxID=85575 RepID=A0ACA9LKV2_9GLOM|nr:5330_t:CDS:1 [Scutellospora calospora]